MYMYVYSNDIIYIYINKKKKYEREKWARVVRNKYIYI